MALHQQSKSTFQFMYRQPSARLRRYIKNYILVKNPFVFNHHQLLLPDTEYMLGINLGGPVVFKKVDGSSFHHPSFSAFLFSHYDKCFSFQTYDLFYIVIHFYPNGLYHFLKQPISSIPFNSYWEMDALATLPVQELVEHACEDKGEQQVIDVIDASLLKHFSTISEADDSLINIMTLLKQHCCHLSIDTLAKHSFTTYRQLDRKFSERVGFTPKQYAQVARFRKAYDQLMTQKSGNMIQIVADHNYYDQTHMIKDFKKFTHLTPKQLVEMSRNDAKNLHTVYSDYCSKH